jgi:hypothetical protein
VRALVQNKPILKILRALLTMTKTLARQEAEFKANCRKQQDDMKARIQRLESQEYVESAGGARRTGHDRQPS